MQLFLGQLAAAGLLGFEVFVQEIESLFIGLGAAHDGKHAFARLIVRRLGNRDPGSRASTNLGDLGTATTNDASNHVGWDADVLRLNLFAVFGDKRVAAVGDVGVGSSAVATALVAEVRAVTGAVVGTAAVTIAGAAGSASGVVVHGAGAN